jgi:hypothetical protein
MVSVTAQKYGGLSDQPMGNGWIQTGTFFFTSSYVEIEQKQNVLY